MLRLHQEKVTPSAAVRGAVTMFGLERPGPSPRTIDRDALVFRKDGYGVRVVDRALLQERVNHEGLIVWELHGESVAGFTDASILNTIRTRIVELQCGVIVIHALRSISAVLFKWLAEFSKSNPWCYIFFDDLDTNLLLLEDLNR